MDRFWTKVSKEITPHPILGTPCWLWTGFKSRKGYGLLDKGKGATRKVEFAHRFAYRLLVGEVPDGQFVLHHCDNPACVNIAHLFLGSTQDNTADMMKKNRQAKGERSGHAVLTENAVRYIRRTYKRRSRSHGIPAIARELGVGAGAVRHVVEGTTWKHVAWAWER